MLGLAVSDHVIPLPDLPMELTNLHSPSTIHLNKFEDPFGMLKRFPALQVLWLHGQQTTEASTYHFPTQPLHLQGLQKLTLTGVMLDGSLIQLSSLTMLTQLDCEMFAFASEEKEADFLGAVGRLVSLEVLVI